MDCLIRYHTAKKLFKIASARFLPPERLHAYSLHAANTRVCWSNRDKIIAKSNELHICILVYDRENTDRVTNDKAKD